MHRRLPRQDAWARSAAPPKPSSANRSCRLLNWTHIPFGDVEALKMIMASCDFSGDRVAAVVIEPIQGEGGINVAPPGYLATRARTLRQIRRDARLRRNPMRHGPHRQNVLLRIRRRRAGSDGARQRFRRRRHAHRRHRRHARRRGRNTSRTRSSTPRPSAATQSVAPPRLRRSMFSSRKISRSKPPKRGNTCSSTSTPSPVSIRKF